jgi:carbamoyl-phosphate synthase large subunit
VPISSDPDYVAALVDICVAEQIGLVVPTIDDELETVAAARARFEERGAIVACSAPETAALCNDKYRACLHLRSHGVEAAHSWLPGAVPESAGDLLFIKPRRGRGSVGAFLVRNRSELDFFSTYVNDAVVQEFLQGPEFTIDVMCDWNGEPVSIVPRERMVIRAGVTDRGRTVKNADLERLALAVTSAIRFRGPLNIQCRMRGDTPVVFEINPRFSGGIALTIAAGADFPAMLLRLASGHAIAPGLAPFVHDLWMTSFETALFLPSFRIRLDPLMPSLSKWSGAA